MSDHVLERRIAQLEHIVRAGFREAKLELAGLREELRRHRLTDIEGRVETLDVRVTALENRPKP